MKKGRRMESGLMNRVALCLLFFALPLNSRGALGEEKKGCWTRHTIDGSSRGADGVRFADVNADGLMDITTPWEEGGRVRVYVNPGPGKARSEWPAVTVGEAGSPEDAVSVDLDADGAVDVVTCSEGNTRNLWVHWAPKRKDDYPVAALWKTQPFPTAKGKQWMFCDPAQLDGGRGVDLVVGAKNTNAELGWLQSPEDPRNLAEWTWRPLREVGWIMSIFARDMDGDRDVDVLASDRKGSGRGCFWLENPGAANIETAEWKLHRIGGHDKEMMFIVPVDLDRDGILDVVAATAGRELLFFRGKTADGLAWETSAIELPEGTGTGKGVCVGDIDLDGKADIVFTCENAEKGSGVMWLSYREAVTDRSWNAHEIAGEEGIKYDLVHLLDIDGDSDLDVVTCEERSNLGVIWYENPTRP